MAKGVRISQEKADFIMANKDTMHWADIQKRLRISYTTVRDYANNNGQPSTPAIRKKEPPKEGFFNMDDFKI